jgi:lipopolysaccharide/colanic/teichoic acid biosynthesis glycosyltransferase
VLTPRSRREVERRHTPSHGELELVLDDETELPERSLAGRIGDAFKRLVDFSAALVGVIVLLPVFIVVAVAIKIDSPGPVFFAHRRLGRNGRHFDCLKFRTMQTDAERHVFENEALRHHYVSNDFKIPQHIDPRITRLGALLRKSSIDELPQLWNVMAGEMSLVGPRPIVALEATHYGDRLPLLLSVRPGLTGLWAVAGRNLLGYPERADVELSYVRERSLGMDLRILASTPWTVITQRGTI